ncbi:BatA domain-containing protein [Maribacter sp. 2308TA10-17]|uniref:BatA domain-containing protein n=1 Tax=Maribacter sp. 2308TA10-17 TaxID=3386276 RepID=UPI0039BD6381
MQFKHPELLWALFLLLIPIFIHLFQLRRFQKTPFTNVKFLKKVVSESRRSNSLKKWLLLFTRMLLLAALIVAFAQPFIAEKNALQEKETVIYLDDSFSMQAKTNNSTLLEEAVQNLIQSIPEDQTFSLLTNEKVFKNVTLKNIRNDLLQLSPTSKQLKLNEIYLKANTFFEAEKKSIKNLIVISDFQQSMALSKVDSTQTLEKHLVSLAVDELENISIDSVYLGAMDGNNLELIAVLSSSVDTESTPVSLFNGEKLIAKTAATFNKNKQAEVSFTLPKNEVIQGKIEISDSGLSYDNQLFFNIDSKEKIKVLVIGNADSNYLKRIFTTDEFEFISVTLNALNYSDLNKQNLIILNELERIPNALATSLKSFTTNGGNLVITPGVKIDMNSYNSFLSNYNATSFVQRVNYERKITDISFSHPLYRNVFEKNVTNFQSPKVNQYFRLKTRNPNVLSYQDKDPFLVGSNGVFIFSASLSSENSNFKNSPLIVPTFYNMGVNSLKLPELYYTIGNNQKVDIATQLPKDHILKMTKEGYEFIPQQKLFANKISLSFYENPVKDGIYSIYDQDNFYKNLSFNYSRSESDLSYMDISNLNASTKNESITALFQQMQNDDTINALWKWFIILAVLFMLIEVLIQKYL